MKLLVFVFLANLLLPADLARAGEEEPTLKAMTAIRDVEHIRLDSKILGRPFHLLVREPQGASECDACTYPTVFLLDGGGTFPALAGYLQYLEFEEAVPDVMLVGISYAGNTVDEGNRRGTDFTAPSEEREHYGGAGAFQQVLEEEIFPLIAANHPMDEDRRLIFGQSLGGQFVLYTAMTKPALFYGHIASNPALHRNLDFFLEDKRIEGHTRVFVGVASDDSPRFKPFSEKWISHWKSAQHPNFELEARVLDGYAHFSILPESFRQGVIWLLVD